MTAPILIILASAYVGVAVIFGWVRALTITLAVAAVAVVGWALLALGCIL
jgi:hypothetical protein